MGMQDTSQQTIAIRATLYTGSLGTNTEITPSYPSYPQLPIVTIENAAQLPSTPKKVAGVVAQTNVPEVYCKLVSESPRALGKCSKLKEFVGSVAAARLAVWGKCAPSFSRHNLSGV